MSLGGNKTYAKRCPAVAGHLFEVKLICTLYDSMIRILPANLTPTEQALHNKLHQERTNGSIAGRLKRVLASNTVPKEKPSQ